MNTSVEIEAKPRITKVRILKRLRHPSILRYKKLSRETMTRLRRMWTNSELPVWQGFSITRL